MNKHIVMGGLLFLGTGSLSFGMDDTGKLMVRWPQADRTIENATQIWEKGSRLEQQHNKGIHGVKQLYKAQWCKKQKSDIEVTLKTHPNSSDDVKRDLTRLYYMPVIQATKNIHINLISRDQVSVIQENQDSQKTAIKKVLVGGAASNLRAFQEITRTINKNN